MCLAMTLIDVFFDQVTLIKINCTYNEFSFTSLELVEIVDNSSKAVWISAYAADIPEKKSKIKKT